MKSMSRRRFLALSGAAAAPLTPGRVSLAGPQPMTTTAALVAGNTAFAADLYARLRERPGNLFVSPFSISTALAMLSAGARGTTLDEMNTVLHLPADPHPAFGQLLTRLNDLGTEEPATRLVTASAAWGQKGFPWRAAFLDLARKHYGAGLIETDFAESEAARRAINAWAERETREKVKELMPPGVITPLTRMVLTSAVYFKSPWVFPFKPAATKTGAFRLSDGTTTDVPLMVQQAKLSYAEFSDPSPGRPDDRGQLLQLPYGDGELSMLVLLPATADGLARLERRLTADNLADWVKGLEPRRVDVTLPRFRVEARDPLDLNEPLQALGMKQAFDDGRADFSGMCATQPPLYLARVLHKAFVDVNEAGTEAAAATAAVIAVRGAERPLKPAVFRADRPFLFLIRETRTQTVLFLGRLTTPAAG